MIGGEHYLIRINFKTLLRLRIISIFNLRMDIVPAGRVITSNFFQTSSYTQKIYCYYDQVEHAGITYELPPCTDTCDECIDPNITEAGFKLRFQN